MYGFHKLLVSPAFASFSAAAAETLAHAQSRVISG